MISARRKVLAALTTVVALAGGAILAGPASATNTAQTAYTRQALGAGLSTAQAEQLQRQVDAYAAAHPGARQVSANKLTIEGGSVTLPAAGQRTAHDLAAPGSASLSCGYKHLCLQDGGGHVYDYYNCGLYSFTGVGDGTFNNNQTRGTVARFYNSDGSLRWTSTAPQSGTASWTPVFKVRPC